MAPGGDSTNGPNKRRRLSGNSNNDDGDDDMSEEKTVTTSKCKGATTIPIFLKSKSFSWTIVLDSAIMKSASLFFD